MFKQQELIVAFNEHIHFVLNSFVQKTAFSFVFDI